MGSEKYVNARMSNFKGLSNEESSKSLFMIFKAWFYNYLMVACGTNGGGGLSENMKNLGKYNLIGDKGSVSYWSISSLRIRFSRILIS